MGEFDDTLGALLVGQIVATFLYGLSTLQTYNYYVKYPRDGRELKIWVAFIWAADTANIALICHGIYLQSLSFMLEKGLGGPIWAKGERSFDISTGFNVVVAIAVQIFFVKRIFQLSPERYKYWLLGVLSTLVLAHFAVGSVALIKVIQAIASGGTRLGSLTLPAVLPYTLLAVLSDVSIAIALIIHLRSRRSDFEVMNSVINKAITFALTRCIVVSFAAICRLIVFAAMPGNFWFVAMDFSMGKLYANSLLALLNSRRPSHSTQNTSSTLGSDDPMFTTVMHLSAMNSSHGASESASTFTPAHRTTHQRPPESIMLEPYSPADKSTINENTHFVRSLPLEALA